MQPTEQSSVPGELGRAGGARLWRDRGPGSALPLGVETRSPVSRARQASLGRPDDRHAQLLGFELWRLLNATPATSSTRRSAPVTCPPRPATPHIGSPRPRR